MNECYLYVQWIRIQRFHCKLPGSPIARETDTVLLNGWDVSNQ